MFLNEISSTLGTIFSVTDNNVLLKKNKSISLESAKQTGGMTQDVVQQENLSPNFQSRYIAFSTPKFIIYHN